MLLTECRPILCCSSNKWPIENTVWLPETPDSTHHSTRLTELMCVWVVRVCDLRSYRGALSLSVTQRTQISLVFMGVKWGSSTSSHKYAIQTAPLKKCNHQYLIIIITLFTIHIVSKPLYRKCMFLHYNWERSVIRGDCVQVMSVFQKRSSQIIQT